MKSVVYEIKPLGWATCKWLRYFRPSCLTSPLNGWYLRDLPTPVLPGDDWVVLKTRMGGICGSDTMTVLQKQAPDSLLQAYTSQPMFFGHENVAEVVELGSAVDTNWLHKRVVVEPTLACQQRGIEPVCSRCAAGEFGACYSFSGDLGGTANLPAGVSIGYNSYTGGSWSEYFIAHQSQLIEVPAHVTDEQALLVDPFSCSVHGVMRADLSQAERILVYGGAGVLGLGVIGSLRAMGFTGQIDALGRGRTGETLTTRMGADEFVTLPRNTADRFAAMAERVGGTVQRVRFGNHMLTGGYDIVFDCVGSAMSVTESLKFTRSRGQVVMLGTLQRASLDLTPLWFRELTVMGMYGRQDEYFNGGRKGSYNIVLDWIAEGKLDSNGLVTHAYRIDDYREALMVSTKKSQHKAVKVAFDFR